MKPSLTYRVPVGTISRNEIWRISAIFLVGILAYFPVVWLGWIWDDDAYVYSNPLIWRGDGLYRIWFTPTDSPQYYPVAFTVLWLEARLWGLNPVGYHVVNVVVHLSTVVALYFCLRRLKLQCAFAASLIFAIHPVHVETVAWVTEIKNTLSGFFYFAALFVLLGTSEASDPVKQRTLTVSSLLLFACALLSKSVTASLPFAYLLIQWGRSGRLQMREVIRVIPFLCLGLPAAMHTAYLEKYHVGAIGSEFTLSFLDRITLSGQLAWFYALKLVKPFPLVFFYPQFDTGSNQWADWLPFTGVLVVILLGIAAAVWHSRFPLCCILFFGGTLFPVLGLFDVYPFRFSYAADHFQYIASVGVIVLLTGIVEQVISEIRKDPWNRVGYVFLGLVLSFEIVLVWQRLPVFTNEGTLWKDTVERNPYSGAAYNNLGQWYYSLNDFVSAEASYRRALELSHDPHRVHNNLGQLYCRLEKWSDAKVQLQLALREKPNLKQAILNLASVELKLGNPSEAIAVLEAYVAEKADFDAYFRLGLIQYQIGRKDKSLQAFQLALLLRPTDQETRSNIQQIRHELKGLSSRESAASGK